MSIDKHIGYWLRCDGTACKACSGRCTAAYPKGGAYLAATEAKAKSGYSKLRKAAKMSGWKLTRSGDLCPDCVKAAAKHA